jgi:hypothetical protein
LGYVFNLQSSLPCEIRVAKGEAHFTGVSGKLKEYLLCVLRALAVQNPLHPEQIRLRRVKRARDFFLTPDT